MGVKSHFHISGFTHSRALKLKIEIETEASGQLENGFLQVSHNLNYTLTIFFKYIIFLIVLLYKIQHLLLTVHFSIAPM